VAAWQADDENERTVSTLKPSNILGLKPKEVLSQQAAVLTSHASGRPPSPVVIHHARRAQRHGIGGKDLVKVFKRARR
jgi:hypothetical protein